MDVKKNISRNDTPAHARTPVCAVLRLGIPGFAEEGHQEPRALRSRPALRLPLKNPKNPSRSLRRVIYLAKAWEIYSGNHGVMLCSKCLTQEWKVIRVANDTYPGIESKLWAAADALRNNMDAAEYKHVVLGLIFLKYISDAFEAKHAELETQKAQGADPEDPDEYRAASIFWVPKEARWSHLRANAPQPTIGKLVDDAMSAIERDNPSLKGVLPKDFGRPGLDKQRLGQLINLVSDIGLGSPADRAKDVLGHVYEYFLAQFASAEGKKGGQFYTPSWVVRVLVEMLAPYKGRVYDPCCGSGAL